MALHYHFHENSETNKTMFYKGYKQLNLMNRNTKYMNKQIALVKATITHFDHMKAQIN